MMIFWKSFATGFFSVRARKISFQSFVTNRFLEFFWFFAWSYKCVKAECWVQLFFKKTFFGVFLGHKDSTMGLKWNYLSFMANSTMIFYLFFSFIYLKNYCSLPKRRDATPINFVRIFHQQLLFQPPRLLKIAQTSHHHVYSRHHVY